MLSLNQFNSTLSRPNLQWKAWKYAWCGFTYIFPRIFHIHFFYILQQNLFKLFIACMKKISAAKLIKKDFA